MTTVQTFEDILAAMRENPVLREAMRQHVRDEEFTSQILSDLVDLKAGQARMEARQDRIMEDNIAEITAGQARMEARQDRMEARQDRMEDDITEITAGQARMEARQDRMEDNIAEITAGQARMEDDITDIKITQARMQGQLNNLTGTDYERRVARDSPRTVRRYLGIRNAQVVHSLNNFDDPHLSNLLEQATSSGIISDDQADDLARTDLILLGQTLDGEPAYIVAEVSVTIDERDVDRAAQRARILQTASGVAAQAAVIGTAISDANRQRANADGVTYIALAE
jgi:hypothetical protein